MSCKKIIKNVSFFINKYVIINKVGDYMYDINLKNVKKGRFFFYIFLLAGIFFFCLLVSTFIFNTIRLKTLDSSIMSSSVEVYSYTNEDGDIMYKSIYYYNVDAPKGGLYFTI